MKTNLLTGELELTPKEAAEYLGVSVGHLNNDRSGKRRVPFTKVFNKITYKLSDLEALKVYHKAAA